ncbi:MAG: DUF2264 domain-containing protein [Bacteroidetes bacterium]|nr:DUF2264 domain-containing protein [Bacteroidota bacterium]
MQKLIFKTPYDFDLSPHTGWTRNHWNETFMVLMRGIINSASEDKARQRIPGPRSHHGLLADELEGFSRSMIMSGPWLNSSSNGQYTYDNKEYNVAEFYRKGILAGTNPKHPEYWGDIVDYAQHLVEMAALSWGIYLSKELIWDKFTPEEKQQVGNYLFQCTTVKYHQNNWLLFNVITNSVLKKLGMPYEQNQIDINLKACDDMYIGGGWYRDGKLNRIDYYNSWGFLYYYLLWVMIDGDSKPDIASLHKDRTRKFANDFKYFVSGDGSTPCFGRSMIYRFGYLAPIVLGKHLGCLDLSDGEVKTITNSVMNFFFSNEILTDAGHLSLGYLKPCAEMLEHYSCGGSPYWATKAFNILLINSSDSFWKAKEEELPIHKESFSKPIKDAGLLLLGDKKTGHVQLINQKSYHDSPEYNDKYTKFAYSSIFSYESRKIYNNFNCDNILQFSIDGINFKQRWEMENLYCIQDFAASKYPIFEVDPYCTIHTSIIVKDDFMINVHLVETNNSLVFKEGGYPLGYDEGEVKTASSDSSEIAFTEQKLSYIKNLHGYSHHHKATPFNEDINGSNVRYKNSVVPYLSFENGQESKFILSSMVCGRASQNSIEEMNEYVKEFKVNENQIRITFYDGEEVFLQIGDVSKCRVELNKEVFSGEIVLARVDKLKTKKMVLYKDGKVEESN